jgi:hypothetical protein
MKNLVINPIKVKVSELKVGQLYVDSVKNSKSKMCVLEFVEYDEEGGPYFKYIDGYNPYISNSNGLFGFPGGSMDWDEVVSFED